MAWMINVLCTPSTRKFFAEAIADYLPVFSMAKLPSAKTCGRRTEEDGNPKRIGLQGRQTSQL
jgi:hypothetical protein